MSACYFSRKNFHGRKPVVVDIGCSCRPKLKYFFTSLFSSSSSDSSSKRSNTATSNSSSTTCSWDPMTTSTTSYYEATTPSPPILRQSDEAARTRMRSRRRGKKKKNKKAMDSDAEGRVARESVAVVKETTEPYVAFKESMVQMIVEKEMYGWDDLNDLLGRFLALNSPCHHRFILQAFADLWNGTTVAASTSSATVEDHNCAASPSPYNYYYY